MPAPRPPVANLVFVGCRGSQLCDMYSCLPCAYPFIRRVEQGSRKANEKCLDFIRTQNRRVSASITLRRAGHIVKFLPPSLSFPQLVGLNAKAAKFEMAKNAYMASGQTLGRVYKDDYSAIKLAYGVPWYLHIASTFTMS
ncbi:hypothetical protein K432DRAFT_396523 [Lepidopterella palustris CBS 459.81]|uniref:Uncharacterized protein n=1 Tax=Lepidopterella palustris CBS 459.81 TaxID=1314670 RepID=A0A8E2E2S8_9PEZI|nr:hypothetical protein K432DRAFT_396523 [Lepidopterella palustris CBS 459.81]